MDKKKFRVAKKNIEVSVGESVKIIRELQDLTQTELAELTGIPQATISAIEKERIKLGLERAKIIARALQCHPAILVFPGCEVEQESSKKMAPGNNPQRHLISRKLELPAKYFRHKTTCLYSTESESLR